MRHICIACSTEYDAPPAWCWTCGSSGVVVPIGRRRLAAVDAEPQLTTARQLAAGAWNLVAVPAYGIRLLVGAFILVFGAPGSGKTTWALRASASMRGPQVFLSAEERLGPSLGERLQRVGVRSETFHIVGRSTVDQLVDVCRRVKARVLTIDSITVGQWIPSDVRHLIQRLDLDALVAVAQVTKDGTAAGSNAWAHEADVVVHVAERVWTIEKSRFEEIGNSGGVQ